MVVVVATKSNLVSCNFPTLKNHNNPPPHVQRCTVSVLTHRTKTPLAASGTGTGRGWCFNTHNPFAAPFRSKRRDVILICRDSNKESQVSSDSDGRDWTTSILLFLLWAGLLYYVSFLSPNQTPSRDMYFLKKLLNLKGDDGFRMNEVLVSVWYIMGLWPLVYSKLLLPTGRSSKSNIPVWPFLVVSCFGGIYALLPYFVLWKPPAPPVQETELKTRPLNLLESKLTSTILLATGIGLITYAGLAGEDVWKEYYQYFRESKFVATKFPANALPHRPTLLQYVVSAKVKTTAQLDAALSFLASTGLESLDLNKFEEACGVGVEVSAEDIKHTVNKVFEENKASILELRYRTNGCSCQGFLKARILR